MGKKILITIFIFVMTAVLIESCSLSSKNGDTLTNNTMAGKTDTAVFGAGCFWCTEALYERLKGVQLVDAGYSGGTVENPSYEQVCSGESGHAEVARIIYDPSVITYEQLLDVFWTVHDPTTLNRQGEDVGEQYRSVIFYKNDDQKQKAEKSKKDVATTLWKDPIVTEISPLKNFYVAENYHQQYYDSNPYAGYCQAIIAPKIIKFSEKFKDWIK